MQPLLAAAKVRELDQAAIAEGIPGLVLMENAGSAVSSWILRATPKASGAAPRFWIACGKGNNGGDGFVIARHLDSYGFRTTVLLCSDPGQLRGDAASNFGWLKHTNAEVHVVPLEQPVGGPPSWLTELEQSSQDDWAVDAMLGTGSRGVPRAPLNWLIEVLNRAKIRRLAIDIPSGLDGDQGQPSHPTFRAEDTLTFVAAKPGLVSTEGQSFVGRLHVVPIGIPSGILDRFGLRVRDANLDAD